MEDLAASLVRAEGSLRERGVTGRRAFEAIVAALTCVLEGGEHELWPGPAHGDLFGLAWERFFPDLFRARLGQFFTPAPLAELLVERLGDLGGTTVFDPTCGAGSLLVAAGRRGALVVGVEVDPDLASLARLHLRLAGVTGVIHTGDGFEWSGIADVVIANPPFSQPVRGSSIQVPARRVVSEVRLLERLPGWLSDSGRAAVLLPWSIASNPTRQGLRDWLGTQLHHTAIARLPEGTFRPFGGAGGRVLAAWFSRVRPDAVSWTDVVDPGWDVRLRRIVRTSADLRSLSWSDLPTGAWAPEPKRGQRCVRDVASLVRQRWQGRGPARLLELNDVAGGVARPRDGQIARRGRWRLATGDVVFPRLRPAHAACGVVLEQAVAGSPEWVVLRFVRGPRWAVHAMETPSFRASLPSTAGQTHPRITARGLLDTPIPWADETLVDRVDRLSERLHARRQSAELGIAAVQQAVDVWASSGDDDVLAETIARLEAE